MATSFAARLQKREALVYDLRVTRTNGKEVYFILKVEPRHHRHFRAMIASGEAMNLEDFGIILHSGWGEPPDTLKAELRENYGMYEE